MIRKWFKVKKLELELKFITYSTVNKLITEKSEAAALLARLYTSLKEAPPEDLKNQFISELSHIIHEQAEKERSLKED